MEIIEKLVTLEKEASAFGFKWENTGQILNQIRSELREIEDHLGPHDNKDKLQEEIGDLLHAVFSLCVFCKFDAYETLDHSINKFERRFRQTQELARKEGLKDLNKQPFSKLMELWDKSKELVG